MFCRTVATADPALDAELICGSVEKTGRLNRAIEFLPDDEALAQRLGRIIVLKGAGTVVTDGLSTTP